MTLRQFYTDSSSSLESVDVRTIIRQILGIDGTRFVLDMDKEVPQEKLGILQDSINRRKNGEPVAYITGQRGFYENIFKVSEDTLIPRADTEILVEDALNELLKSFGPEDEIRILDICCGTGCIGISVAKALSRSLKTVHLTLSDLSGKALEVCRENVKTIIRESNIEVKIIQSDLFEDIEEQSFDAILSNPPYIKTDIIPTLEKQVRFEPILALDGGEDGLDFIRVIAEQAKDHLAPGGLLEMEIGYDQGKEATAILKNRNYREITIIRDLENCDRVVKAFN